MLKINNIIKDRFINKNQKLRHQNNKRIIKTKHDQSYDRWFNFYFYYNLDKIYFSNYYIMFVESKTKVNSFILTIVLFNFDNNGKRLFDINYAKS